MNPFKFFKRGISKNEYQKSLITFFIVFVISALLTFVITPAIVKGIISYKMVMKPGHYLRKLHEKIPFTFKFYLWNVTNPDEIANNGAKPILHDVGPYVFE